MTPTFLCQPHTQCVYTPQKCVENRGSDKCGNRSNNYRPGSIILPVQRSLDAVKGIILADKVVDEGEYEVTGNVDHRLVKVQDTHGLGG